MKCINLSEYNDLVLNIIKNYYKYIFYYINNGIIISNDDIDYYKIIDESSIEDLLSFFDNEFLSLIIKKYLTYSISSIKVEESIVNNYYNENVNAKIKTKLKEN